MYSDNFHRPTNNPSAKQTSAGIDPDAQTALTTLHSVVEKMPKSEVALGTRCGAHGAVAGSAILLGDFAKAAEIIKGVMPITRSDPAVLSELACDHLFEALAPYCVAAGATNNSHLIGEVLNTLRQPSHVTLPGNAKGAGIPVLAGAIRTLAAHSQQHAIREILRFCENPELQARILVETLSNTVCNLSEEVGRQNFTVTLYNVAAISREFLVVDALDLPRARRFDAWVLKAFVSCVEGDPDTCEKLLRGLPEGMKGDPTVSWLYGFSLGTRIRSDDDIKSAVIMKSVMRLCGSLTDLAALEEIYPWLGRGLVSATRGAQGRRVSAITRVLQDTLPAESGGRQELRALRHIHRVACAVHDHDEAAYSGAIDRLHRVFQKSSDSDCYVFVSSVADMICTDLLVPDRAVRTRLADALVRGTHDLGPDTRTMLQDLLLAAGFTTQAQSISLSDVPYLNERLLHTLRLECARGDAASRGSLSSSAAAQAIAAQGWWEDLAREVSSHGTNRDIGEIVSAAARARESDPESLGEVCDAVFWGLARRLKR